MVKGAATDCMLSLTIAWVRIPAWACEKVASDLGLGVKDFSLGDDNLLSSIGSTAVFYGGEYVSSMRQEGVVEVGRFLWNSQLQ